MSDILGIAVCPTAGPRLSFKGVTRRAGRRYQVAFVVPTTVFEQALGADGFGAEDYGAQLFFLWSQRVLCGLGRRVAGGVVSDRGAHLHFQASVTLPEESARGALKLTRASVQAYAGSRLRAEGLPLFG